MIDYCPFCGKELTEEECCLTKKNRSNMVDTSIFLEAFDETPFSRDCKLILDGAKRKIYLGYVSTIILGEIMKKLLRLKKEADYRYSSIHENVLDYLMHFKTLYICEDTLKTHLLLNIRGKEQSQDKVNLACAIHNKLSMFIIKDKNFTVDGKIKPTHVAQIIQKNTNKKLKSLIKNISDKINFPQSL